MMYQVKVVTKDGTKPTPAHTAETSWIYWDTKGHSLIRPAAGAAPVVGWEKRERGWLILL